MIFDVTKKSRHKSEFSYTPVDLRPTSGKKSRSGLYIIPDPKVLAAYYQVHDEEMSEDDAGAEHAGQQHV